jgi:hypothetical protein
MEPSVRAGRWNRACRRGRGGGYRPGPTWAGPRFFSRPFPPEDSSPPARSPQCCSAAAQAARPMRGRGRTAAVTGAGLIRAAGPASARPISPEACAGHGGRPPAGTPRHGSAAARATGRREECQVPRLVAAGRPAGRHRARARIDRRGGREVRRRGAAAAPADRECAGRVRMGWAAG